MLQFPLADTLKIRSVNRPPSSNEAIDANRLGSPQIRLATRQGTAQVWLLRWRDTVFIAASLPDSTPYWGDDFVVSIDTQGDGAPTPQHDDFQLYFMRTLDSSVVFRGRNGRWEPPRDDPDWRLGADRSGGGWEVSSRNGPSGWSVLLRLNPAWLAGKAGRLARVAVRIYDDAPHGWYSWPHAGRSAGPTVVEHTPALWAPVR